jgi:hypothetical protein
MKTHLDTHFSKCVAVGNGYTTNLRHFIIKLGHYEYKLSTKNIYNMYNVFSIDGS